MEKELKKLLLIISLSFLISTFWYGPKFWWQIIFSSSFGGQPFYAVVNQLVKLLPVALAIVLGIFGGKILKTKNTLTKFSFYWLFIFGFLTGLRFLSDPDYWLDWSAYGMELQMGIALFLTVLIRKSNLPPSLKLWRAGKFLNFKLGFAICILNFALFVYIFNNFVIGTLQSDITQAVEYRIGSFLSENINKNDKVFLSGTTSFWLNSWFDVVQLRGGRDPAANLPGWDKVAWEVREGSDPDKSIVQLKKFGIKYLVIHTGLSREYYHDFKYPDKFEAAGGIKKIFDDNGDKIYIME